MGYSAVMVLRWPHHRGGEAQCLVQLRSAVPHRDDPDVMVVVASELRDPRAGWD